MHPGGSACTRLAVVAARARGASGVSSSGAYRFCVRSSRRSRCNLNLLRRMHCVSSRERLRRSPSRGSRPYRGVERLPATPPIRWSSPDTIVQKADSSPRASVGSRRPTSGRIRQLAKYSTSIPCIVPGLWGDLRDLCSIQLHARECTRTHAACAPPVESGPQPDMASDDRRWRAA
jgi:hypothetical protein